MDYDAMTLEELLALEHDLSLTVQRLEQSPFDEVENELLAAQDELYKVEQARIKAEERARQEAEQAAAAAAAAASEAEAKGLEPPPQTERPKKTFRGGESHQSLSGETIHGSVETASEEEGLSYTINLPRVPTGIYSILDAEVDPLVTFVLRWNAPAPQRSSTFRGGASGSSFFKQDLKHYRVTSEIQHYSTKSVALVKLRPGDEKTVRQLPTLILERVKDINELTRATIDITIERQKDLESPDWILEAHASAPIWLLAKSSAPQAVRDPKSGEWNDLTRYLGAFVTPNTPEVIRFLRTAVDYHPNKRLDGYQSPVRAQVEAIYNALKKRGISYVDSVIDFNPSQNTQSQRVRLPSESLEHCLANCIDGVVLFASLMQGISVNPCIVVLPRHAIVGWETGPQNDQWEYLETTMLSTHEFEQALDVGNRRVQAYQQRFEQTQDPAWYRRWSLRDLRTQYGIMPMG
jgi:hypothetical protein